MQTKTFVNLGLRKGRHGELPGWAKYKKRHVKTQVDGTIKAMADKISSYNLFNNLLPGIIFCHVVERTTRISITGGGLLENLFLYYFVGMVLSRVGSLLVESCLSKLSWRSRDGNKRKPFLELAPYDKYKEVSEKHPFIKTLNETNNTYRTIVALFLAVAAAKIYDWLLYDCVISLPAAGRNLLIIVICLAAAVLFAFSYRKQTGYIRKDVERCLAHEENK